MFDLKGLSKSKMLMLTVDANELGTMYSRYHADSEYKFHMGVDHNGMEFIGNRFTHSRTYSAL